MAKERNYNPVQAQRKADKAKAIKKGKAEVAAARNERLAKKNPERVQKQIADLKAITEGGGKLTAHETQVLEGLEKELKAVTKAREALGDKAPTFGRSGGGGLGGPGYGGHDRKRRRNDNDDDDDDSTDGSDVPEDVRRIPMPRDTPPPIPKKHLDAWYEKRRARARRNHNANAEPLGAGRTGGRGEGGGGGGGGDGPSRDGDHKATAAAVPPPVAKAVYEAKPVIRDLQKEAVTAFVPTVVRRKLDKSRGLGGGLLEPEEADQLEKEGYLAGPSASAAAAAADAGSGRPLQSLPGRPAAPAGPHQATVEEADDEG